MKNSKMFFTLLVIASISCLCNASENSESTALIPVEQVVIVSTNGNNEHDEPRILLEQLFNDCYRQDEAQACQQLIALFTYKMMTDRAESRKIIASQQQQLKILHDREKRRTARRKLRHEKRNQANAIEQN